MHKTKEITERMGEIEKRLTFLVESACAHGLEDVDHNELSEVIDMIKDLAEAKEKSWKGCYYKKICEAMEEEEEKETPWYMQIFGGRPGYDNWRYSSGRFAPTGRGHYAGYTPTPYYDTWPNKTGDWDMGRMGYVGSDGQGRISSGNYDGKTSGYMVPYDMYQDARRHYTESHSAEDKTRMDGYAMEHMSDTIETVKDIWADADPNLRKKMKADLSALIGEMTI